jgi:hypothetical protein
MVLAAVIFAPFAHAQDPVPSPDPTPSTTAQPTNLTPAELARIAAEKLNAIAQASSHYTYYQTELNQQTMDGALVVNHTTVYESIFLGGLPYLHRISLDGAPLGGKELARENKLYDEALRDRRSLDAETRARLNKSLTRSTSRTDLDQLATYFHLHSDGLQTLDNHTCFLLDATPIPGLDVPSVQRHIRIALDATTLDLVDISIEFLADDSGFSKGTLIHTRYAPVAGVNLPAEQDFDTVIVFKELLNKPVKVHKVLTFSNYRRFRATVTIKMADGEPPPPPEPAAKTSKPAKAPKTAKPASDSGGWFWQQPKKPADPTPAPPPATSH